MSEFTKVGPPDKDDLPGKKNRFFEAIWRGAWIPWLGRSWGAPFGWLLFWKAREIEERAEPVPVEDPWYGLPEAELTQAQERQALSDEAWRREHREK